MTANPPLPRPLAKGVGLGVIIGNHVHPSPVDVNGAVQQGVTDREVGGYAYGVHLNAIRCDMGKYSTRLLNWKSAGRPRWLIRIISTRACNL